MSTLMVGPLRPLLRHAGTVVLVARLLAVMPACAAPEASSTVIRVGDHAGYGRVVFDLPSDASFDLVTEGDRLLVVFRGAGPVIQPANLPRNVVSLQTGVDTATLQLAPGASPRSMRIGNRLVIDIAGGPRARHDTLPAAASPASVGHRSGPSPANAHGQLGAPPTESNPQAGSKAGGPSAALHTPVGENGPVAKPVLSSSSDSGESAPRVPLAADPSFLKAAPVTKQSALDASEPAAAQPSKPKPSVGEAPAAEMAPSAAPVISVSQKTLSEPPAPPSTTAEADQPASTLPSPAPVAAAASMLIRADPDVGAAAFRRGEVGLIVLDRRIPVPPAPPGTAWLPGAVSMTLQVPLSPGEDLRVARVAAGWSVRMGAEPAVATLQPSAGEDAVLFKMPRPGRVVTTLDPLTGGTLLIGTSLAEGPEATSPDMRRTPGYVLLPTWLGIALVPNSDQLDLRASQTGFVLTGGATPAPMEAAAGSRRFDFPDQPPAMLLNRLHAQLAGAAAAAPRARTPERVAAAQTMLALGMAAEAQSLMQLVAAEDPQAAADAQVEALGAISAMLGGRLKEADALDDPRLDGTDEIALWRGLRDTRLGLETAAARRLADVAQLARSYPQPLRSLVWPEAAEAIVAAGKPLPPEDAPRFAEAMRLERAGKVEDALAAFDKLAAGRDRLDQVRAAAHGAELRLSAGLISPAAAAAVFERQSFAWRGDAREAALRMRAAELRGTAGEWRAALDALRALDQQFPDRHDAVQLRKAAVLQAMLAVEGGELSPLDLVLLAAEYADGVPGNAQGGALAKLLADKLMALDLPARAIPVLQGLMRTAPTGEPRAEFGVRLAQLLLDGGDPTGAATALDGSSSPDLSAGLRESRALLQARVRAAAGDGAGAVAALFELGTATADNLRAELLAGMGDWRGSLSALSDLAAKLVPSEGALSEAAQDVLLRQATAASRVPDPASLRALERYTARMTGPRANLFRVLTAPPVSMVSDLPRAAQELKFARALPGQLNAAAQR